MNEYIQEILEKYEHMDTDMMSLYYAEEAMRKMYKRGIEDSLKCVPEKAIKPSFLDTEHLSNTQYIHASGVIDGRNMIRQQTIDNIKSLLDNK